jgi:co-chaperonin GroES (HSP10)
MKALGNNILIKPKPRERVLASGIIVPETAKDPRIEWGEVVDGNNVVPTGSSVMYFGLKCFTNDGVKVVAVNKVLYWEE